MAAYRRVDDLRSPAGWLPVHRDQLRAQRSVSSMGKPLAFISIVTRITRIETEVVQFIELNSKTFYTYLLINKHVQFGEILLEP